MQKGSHRRPTGAVYDEFLADDAIRIVAFGRYYYPDSKLEEDWTTTPLQEPEDGERVVCSLTRHLPRIAEELGISRILAPSAADFNARICTRKDLKIHIPIGSYVTLMRGLRADGCLLRRGWAYLVTPAGCADTTMWIPSKKNGYTRRVGTTHTGLRSIVDYPSTRPEGQYSVVQTLLRAVTDNNRSLVREVRVHIALPIAPREFTHPWGDPRRGKKNHELCLHIAKKWGAECLLGEAEDGCIDLVEITRRQSIALGIPEENVSCGISATILNDSGTKLLYSTRGNSPNCRNALFVVRYA